MNNNYEEKEKEKVEELLGILSDELDLTQDYLFNINLGIKNGTAINKKDYQKTIKTLGDLYLNLKMCKGIINFSN